MGKTKTSFVEGVTAEKKTSAEAYREKKERQATTAKIHIAGLKGGQRIKTIEAEILPEDTKIEEPSFAGPTSHKATRAPRLRGKKYQSVKVKIEAGKKYSLSEAIKLVKATSYSAFDGTIETHLVVKKTGLSAQVTLPYSAGKEKKIEIADAETLKKLAKGKIDFDILLATPEMMPKLIPFAKILGPKGLMPNPKNGTIVKSVKEAAKFSGKTLSLKTEKEAPLVHTVIGKVSQKDTELLANLEAILGALGEKQIMRGYLKATMGPSVKVAI